MKLVDAAFIVAAIIVAFVISFEYGKQAGVREVCEAIKAKAIPDLMCGHR